MTEERELSPPVLSTDLYPPGKYLKAIHLKGATPTLEIEHVGRREVPDPKAEGEFKLEGYVIFKRTESMVKNKTPYMYTINVTARKALECMFGERISDWIGKRITLHTVVDYRPDIQKRGPCLRFKGSPDISEKQTFILRKKTKNGMHSTTHTMIPTGGENGK